MRYATHVTRTFTFMTTVIMAAISILITFPAYSGPMESVTIEAGLDDAIEQGDVAVLSTVHALDNHTISTIDAPTLTVDEERSAQDDMIVKQKALQKEEYISSIQCDPMNVTKITNLTLSDMKLLTTGTWWEGYEKTLWNLEHTYGINAVFAMAVSTLESGSGTSSKARTKQNYYGVSTNSHYGDRYGSTVYFGDLLQRKYISKGLYSVYSIGPVYCPPNRKWEDYMASYMTNKLAVVKERLRNQPIV